MNAPSNRPTNPWAAGTRQGTSGANKGRTVVIGAGVFAVVLCVVVGAWFLGRSTSGEGAASPTTGTTGVTGGAKAAASPTVTTVTVAPEPTAPTAVPPPDTSPTTTRPEPEPGGNTGAGSGPLACDGRGVLVVNSIYGNSPGFRQEVDTSLAENPGSVLMNPGDCPSLRPRHNGAAVYAVVVDYGDDLASLCTDELNGGGNARLLNSDTSYSSPC